MKKILWMMVLAVGLMSCGAARLSPEERAGSAESKRHVEKLTEMGNFIEKNGICLHMSFIFTNFALAFLRCYEDSTDRIRKDGAHD